MKIKWFGQSCFEIETHDIKIITDPYNSRIGFKLPDGLEADLITVSHQHSDHNEVSAIGGDPKIIDVVGAVTIDGVKFVGFPSFHDDENGEKRGTNIIYKIDDGQYSVCHLGDLGHRLSPELVNEIGVVNVLMIPVGGTYTIDAAAAIEVVNQIKPKIIIPMHYQIKGLSLSTILKPVDDFLGLYKGVVENTNELVLNKDEIGKPSRVVVLSRHS